MKRRDFLRVGAKTGAALGMVGLAAADSENTVAEPVKSAEKPTFRDLGWVWEGEAIDPGVPPSIYGLGQGGRYFGLSRVNFLFHPNDAHALRLLEGYDEVTCDISKWGVEWDDKGCPKNVAKSDPATVRREGELVARLAEQFTNITGVYCDDLLGLMKRAKYGPKQFGEVRAAIRAANPKLKLWSVVYTHEFDKADFWAEMRPHIDVVTLWIWDSENIVHQSEYVEQCRKLFPEKPIVMGVYLRDFGKVAPVPVKLVRLQMEGIADLISKGLLDGYSILGAFLIDGHRAQADAVRDFIIAQSKKA